VARIQGSALINQGEQYVSAREGMAVKEGDRLIATEGSSAVIKFNDGCQYTLADTQVLTVGPASTCASSGAVASVPANPKPAMAVAATSGLIFAGSLATVVAVGAATGSSGSNNNGVQAPISP